MTPNRPTATAIGPQTVAPHPAPRRGVARAALLAGVALVVLVLAACEAPIDVDFPRIAPRLVIEGYVTNLPGPQTVRISRTIDYDQPNTAIPQVSGARVIIWDNVDQRDTLTEVAPGVYQTERIVGLSHRTYYLQVEVDGQTITAQSTLPDVVPLLALFLQDTVRPPTYQRSKYATTYGRDPDTVGNYYRQRYYTNDSLHNGSFDYLIIEDKYVNGNDIIFPYGYTTQPGDTITVELMSLTREGFLFHNGISAQQIAGSPVAPPPADVYTNLRGAPNLLGVFSAEGRFRISTIVP